MTVKTKLKPNQPLPTLASQLLALDLDFEDARYDEWRALTVNLKDEIAMARCLARRGLPPEEAWKTDPADPRLAAWRRVHEDSLLVLVERISEWRMATNNTSLEALTKLAGDAKRLNDVALITLAGHEEMR